MALEDEINAVMKRSTQEENMNVAGRFDSNSVHAATEVERIRNNMESEYARLEKLLVSLNETSNDISRRIYDTQTAIDAVVQALSRLNKDISQTSASYAQSSGARYVS